MHDAAQGRIPAAHGQVAAALRRRLRWVAIDPAAAFDQLRALTLEERGALVTVRALILARAGELADHDAWLARALNLDIRVWRRLRARLVALGLLYAEAGRLGAPCCDRQLAEAAARLGLCAESPATSPGSYGHKSGPVSSISNDLAPGHKNMDINPPLPPAEPGASAPDHDQVGDEDAAEAALQEVVAAWPKPGKLGLARAHWRAKLAAGLPLDQLKAACLARARDAGAKRVLLASFLRDADFSAAPVVAPVAAPAPDPRADVLGQMRLAALQRGLGGQAEAAVARVLDVLGEAEAVRRWRHELARGVDRALAWQAVSWAARQAVQ